MAFSSPSSQRRLDGKGWAADQHSPGQRSETARAPAFPGSQSIVKDAHSGLRCPAGFTAPRRISAN